VLPITYIHSSTEYKLILRNRHVTLLVTLVLYRFR